MQQMSPDDVVFMRRTMEMPSLRSTLLDQKYIDAAIKDQLTRSPDIKFISIVQQIEEVSLIHKSAVTHTITGAGALENTRRQRWDDVLRLDPHGISSDFIRAHIKPLYTQTEHSEISTRREQVQQTSHDEVFIRQQTELVSLRNKPLEQRHFLSALKQQFTRTTEIRIVEQFEDVSVIHNSTAINGSSGHEDTGNRHVFSSNDRQQNQPQPRPPYAHSKQSESPTTWSRNRGNSTAIRDSSPYEHPLRQKCNERSDILRTSDTDVVSSDDGQPNQPQPGPPFSHSKQSESPTRKEHARKCSWNRGYSDDKTQHQLPEPSLPRSQNVNQSGRSTRKNEPRKCSWNRGYSDDKMHHQLPEPSLPRSRNVKQSETSTRKKQCRRSNRNKKGDRKECPRRLKSSNDAPKSSLSIRQESKTYTCAECNKRFSLKHNLAVHLRIHSGEKPFGCKTCNKDFRRNSDLTKHLRIHSGEKPFKCKTCNRAFNRKNNLTTHLMVHSGEKPFECSTCKRAFNQKIHLTQHLLVHSGEKPFKCRTCKRAFNQKGNLKTHLMLHSGEKPFECSTCKRAFNQKIHLKKHLLVHSGEI